MKFLAKTPLIAISVALAMLVSCVSYETVPETGRRRPALQHTEAEMDELGAHAYVEATKDYRVITGTRDARMVADVAKRIAAATGKNYDWEFKLLDAPKVPNAFCLPGGKIAVFSGILPYTKNEDGLAVVVGHEVAHATLQHGNERMSQPVLKQIIGIPVGMVAGLWGTISPTSRRAVMGGLGLGYLVGEFMPYSQQDEIEADDVGLRYMNRAGFDIREAPRFWERMHNAFHDKSDPLSSHPDSEKRTRRMRELVSEMLRDDAAKGKAAPQ